MGSETAQELLRELAAWRPQGGVVSVYLRIDPADRGEGWRIELRHALDGVDSQAAERVLERFGENAGLPHGRTQVGFVELGGDRREVWNGFQVDGQPTEVSQADRPCLAPLVKIVDDGWPLGIVLVALESVRVIEWGLGELDELAGWELELTSLDWRERKAQSRDAGTGTRASASGRDQYRQRLDHNRERFLKQAGGLIARRYGERPWRHVVVFGEGDRPRLLARGLGALAERVHEVDHDLIRAPLTRVGERLSEEVEHLNRAREEALVARLRESIGSGAGAALGPEEVLDALSAGRVRQLLYDADREWKRRDGVALNELMIERALATSAKVTPVEGLAAQAMTEHDGAAAILRY